MSNARAGWSSYRPQEHNRQDDRPRPHYGRDQGPPPRDLFPERAQYIREQSSGSQEIRDPRDNRETHYPVINRRNTRDVRERRNSRDTPPYGYEYNDPRTLSPRANAPRRGSNTSPSSIPPPRRRSPTPPYYGQDRGSVPVPPRIHRPRAEYGDSYRPAPLHGDPRPSLGKVRSSDLIRRAEPVRPPARDYYIPNRLTRDPSAHSERERLDREREAREYKAFSANRSSQQTVRNPRAASYGDHVRERAASSFVNQDPRRPDKAPLPDTSINRRVSAPVTASRPNKGSLVAPQPESRVEQKQEQPPSSFIHPDRCASISAARPPTTQTRDGSKPKPEIATAARSYAPDLVQVLDVLAKKRLEAPDLLRAASAENALQKNKIQLPQSTDDYVNPFDLMDDASSIDDSRPSTGITPQISPVKQRAAQTHSVCDADQDSTGQPIANERKPDSLATSPLGSKLARPTTREPSSPASDAEDGSRSPGALSEASTVHLEDPEAHAMTSNNQFPAEPAAQQGGQLTASAPAVVDTIEEKTTDYRPLRDRDTEDGNAQVQNVSDKAGALSEMVLEHENVPTTHADEAEGLVEEFMSIKSDLDSLRSSNSTRTNTPDPRPLSATQIDVPIITAPSVPLEISPSKAVGEFDVQNTISNRTGSSPFEPLTSDKIPDTILHEVGIETPHQNNHVSAFIPGAMTFEPHTAGLVKQPHELSGKREQSLEGETSAGKQNILEVKQHDTELSLRPRDAAVVDATSEMMDVETVLPTGTPPVVVEGLPAELETHHHTPLPESQRAQDASATAVTNEHLYNLEMIDASSEVVLNSTQPHTEAPPSVAVEPVPVSENDQNHSFADVAVEAVQQPADEASFIVASSPASIDRSEDYIVKSGRHQRDVPTEIIGHDVQAEGINHSLPALDGQRTILPTQNHDTEEDPNKMKRMRAALLGRTNLSSKQLCSAYDPNLAEKVLAENRASAQARASLIRRVVLKEPQEYPFYHHNLADFEANKSKFIAHFKARKMELLLEEEELKQEYERRQKKWLKNAAKCDHQRLLEMEQEEAEATLIASIAAPTRGTRNKPVGYEIREALVGVDTPNNVLNEAVIPPMIHDPFERDLYRYVDLNDQVENPLDHYHITKPDPRELWTEEEQAIFSARYKATPKQFGVIAAGLPGRTAGECVLHYYKTKKVLDYRASGKPKAKATGRGRGRAKKVAVGRTTRRAALATVTVVENDEEETAEEEVEAKSLRKRRAITDIDDVHRKVRSLRKTTKKTAPESVMPGVATQMQHPPRAPETTDMDMHMAMSMASRDQGFQPPTRTPAAAAGHSGLQSQAQTAPTATSTLPPISASASAAASHVPDASKVAHAPTPQALPRTRTPVANVNLPAPQKVRRQQQKVLRTQQNPGPPPSAPARDQQLSQQQRQQQQHLPLHHPSNPPTAQGLQQQRQQQYIYRSSAASNPALPHPFVDARRSKWTDEDESHFVLLLKRYGTDWTAIAAYMVSKTVEQIQKHFDEYLVEFQYRQYLPRSSAPPGRPLLGSFGQPGPASQQFGSRAPLLNPPNFANQYSSFSHSSISSAHDQAPTAYTNYTRPTSASSSQPQASSFPNARPAPSASHSAAYPQQSQAPPPHPQFSFDYRQQTAPPPSRDNYESRYERPRMPDRGSLGPPARGSIDSMLNSGERVQLPPISGSRAPQTPSDARYTSYFTPPPPTNSFSSQPAQHHHHHHHSLHPPPPPPPPPSSSFSTAQQQQQQQQHQDDRYAEYQPSNSTSNFSRGQSWR